ncbi:transposase [Lysinibacillus telephonicus]|uniref:transposase n=1 Tax=Lysinibacillus telephonicus TaxID=1714840 RepID=UPI003BA0AF2C
MSKQRRTYTVDFKLQILKLYAQGKKRADICREHDLKQSTLDSWIKKYQKINLNQIQDNKVLVLQLYKEIEEMNEKLDILKKAVLVLEGK